MYGRTGLVLCLFWTSSPTVSHLLRNGLQDSPEPIYLHKLISSIRFSLIVAYFIFGEWMVQYISFLILLCPCIVNAQSLHLKLRTSSCSASQLGTKPWSCCNTSVPMTWTCPSDISFTPACSMQRGGTRTTAALCASARTGQ